MKSFMAWICRQKFSKQERNDTKHKEKSDKLNYFKSKSFLKLIYAIKKVKSQATK